MRVGLGLLLLLAGCSSSCTFPPDEADGSKRYGIELDTKTYPQATPKEALASVLKAINAKRYDYLLAHLADPAFVDEHVKRYSGGRFEDQVEETRSRLNPGAVKLLGRFLKEGDWPAGDDEVCVRLKEVPDRRVYLRKIGGRWFLEHRYKPAANK